MFRETQKYKQISLSDRLLFANDQTKKAVDSSRAKLVGDVIYPNVDESKFAPLFSEVASRPNIPITQYVCAFILKRMYGLSDEVFIEFLRCGALNFQYALHTTQDNKQPLSESSLGRFRTRLEEYQKATGRDLVKEEFNRISKIMAVDMGLLGKDPSSEATEQEAILVRMDSMEIEAHAKAMSRIEIIYTTILIVLRYLLKKDFVNIIPSDLSHYFEEGDKNTVIYHRHKKDKEEGKQDTRLEETFHEMLILKQVMEANFGSSLLSEIPEYQVFIRVLEEQSDLDENGARILKDGKHISPDSVQNPFDTTVTYRNKNGHHHGFMLNVAEAVDDKGNGIIIDADFEKNTCSDSKAAEKYMERQPDNGPKQIVTVDGSYNSDRIDELSKQKNIEVRATALNGSPAYDVDADFVLNDDETEIVTCPCGHTPVSCKYNARTGKITATMPDNCCATCPHKDDCDLNLNRKKKTSKVMVSGKQVRRALQARGFSTEEGKANARRRNGVEGIMSVLRRKYDIDHIPAFGINRAAPWVWTSLLSYNLVKYQKFLNAKKVALST